MKNNDETLTLSLLKLSGQHLEKIVPLFLELLRRCLEVESRDTTVYWLALSNAKLAAGLLRDQCATTVKLLEALEANEGYEEET